MLLCYCSTQTAETPQNRIDVNYGLTDLMQFYNQGRRNWGGSCSLLSLVGLGGGQKCSKDFHIFQILSGPFNKSLLPCSFQLPASLLSSSSCIMIKSVNVIRLLHATSLVTRAPAGTATGAEIKAWIRDRDAI